MILVALLAGAAPQIVDGWSIERTFEKCIATKTVGVGAASLPVSINTPVSSDFSRTIRIALPPLAPSSGAAGTTPTPEARLNPIDAGGTIYDIDGTPTLIIMLKSVQVARLARARTLSVVPVDRPAVAVALGETKRMLAALSACSDAVLRGLGADPAAMVGSGSLERSASWFTPDDYPADSLRAQAQGRALYLVSVDRAGKPVTCKIVSSTGNASLDAQTCRLAVRRGRYTTASWRGPATRWALNAVNWRLPDE